MAMSSRWTMTPLQKEVRSRIELDLRSYQERVLPEHLQTIIISDRGRYRTAGTAAQRWSSCVSCRCLSRWTTRSSNNVVETGVEPAKSLGSRPSRFSGLRTQPNKWRVQESHLAVRAYEAQLSAGSPASCKPRNRTGLPTL